MSGRRMRVKAWEVTIECLREARARGEDMGWLADHLLSPEARAKYDRACTEAEAVYSMACDAAFVQAWRADAADAAGVKGKGGAK